MFGMKFPGMMRPPQDERVSGPLMRAFGPPNPMGMGGGLAPRMPRIIPSLEAGPMLPGPGLNVGPSPAMLPNMGLPAPSPAGNIDARMNRPIRNRGRY